MKRLAYLVLLSLFIPLIGFVAENAKPKPRPELWKEVDAAIKKGLPKTAVKHLKPILKGSIEDKAYPEAIRALGKKISLEGVIQGNQPQEKIIRLKEAIKESPEDMHPVLESILANWYWHYFQRNRWRFMQRTATAQAPGEDFETWDLPRILAEIDKQYQKALSHADVLKKIPVAEYEILLQKGNAPDSFRPTLYDFIAHEALIFYQSGEQAGSKAQDDFYIEVESPIFATAEAFMAWNPETKDKDSLKLRSIRLYQDLLKFHRKDEDPSAFIDTDLHRLNFGYNSAKGDGKNDHYIKALEGLVEKWADHRISARALHRWAKVIHQEGDYVLARKLALRGTNAFPNTPGGNRCYNLVQSIEAKSFHPQVERVWSDPWPVITMRYRNIDQMHFRAIKANWLNEIKRMGRLPNNYLKDAEKKRAIGMNATKAWSEKLKPTPDYQEELAKMDAPRDLEPGFYYLLASSNKNFSGSDNVVYWTSFWVSDLSLITRKQHGKGYIEGLVLKAQTGDPIDRVKIHSYHRRGNKWQDGPVTFTDKNGFFRFNSLNDRNHHVFLAVHNEDKVSSGNEHWAYKYNHQPKPYERTIFFSDRSLYRPGQTIQFKGICINVDQQRDNYKVIPNRTLTIELRDRNNQKAEQIQVRTNDYGSFSGSFTAPRDRLTGQMRLYCSKPRGNVYFNVEEYKRPKFEVTLEGPDKPAKLGKKVTLTGKATSYTGAAVNDGKVKFRVVRQVRYPYWWSWRYWWRPQNTNQQEIKHGSVQTEADGTFKISFIAKPDPSVSLKDEPTFSYTIYADVTDSTGETRSAQKYIWIGSIALNASVSADAWQTIDNPVEVKVRTTDSSGQKLSAKGKLTIYRVIEPRSPHRPSMGGYTLPSRRGKRAPLYQPAPNPADTRLWETGEQMESHTIETDEEGNASAKFELGQGLYRAIFESKDKYGKEVQSRYDLRVLDPKSDKYRIKDPFHYAAPKASLEPGEEFFGIWGSGYETARAFIEIEHRGKILQKYWTEHGVTQTQIRQKITEPMRGGLTLRITMVRDNRLHTRQQQIHVPWSNKNLKIKWEHFTNKLEPAKKETWTAIIEGKDAKKAAAEMVATLYDASLDAYKNHSWQNHFHVFRHSHTHLQIQFENRLNGFNHLTGSWRTSSRDTSLEYRKFEHEITANLWGYQYYYRDGKMGNQRRAQSAKNGILKMHSAAATPAQPVAIAEGLAIDSVASRQLGQLEAKGKRLNGRDALPASSDKLQTGQAGTSQGPDLSKVTARTNLNETAFFFPHLVSNKEGVVRMEFSMPEALTKWKFMGFAHDADLRAGFLTDTMVTAKDLMVRPNPPRFLREGDILEFTVKVTNQSNARQTGKVRLTFADARTEKSKDNALGNLAPEQDFNVPAKESRTYSWKIEVPDDMDFLTYKAVAATNRLSDGEAGNIPVLSRRIYVTESMALPIRGAKTKKFRFDKLIASGKSGTLRHKGYTVQMVSQPAWYAVMALPYLMEFPHECTEQTFNRYYANLLGQSIAKSDPKIRRIFDLWKGTEALDSPLEKNEDLKSVALLETPWVRQAKNESQARRNVGILFDDNRLTSESQRAFTKLKQMQLGDGSWPWFPGGRGNNYVTLYITTGFARLRHLDVDTDISLGVKALNRLDRWMDKRYHDILRSGNAHLNHLSPTIAMYLYCRSFYLEDKPVPDFAKDAVDYFIGQTKKYWVEVPNRQSQGHLALAMHRLDEKKTAKDIMRSIKQRSVTDQELGRFWRDTEMSHWWYRAPIETQALMIEAFDEVMGDEKAVEDCRVWLLKQKQTQDWKTTKATADAIYGLLLRGKNLLGSDALVEVAVGGHAIKPEKVEAGTGFYEKRFDGSEVEANFGKITLKKVDEGVSWGSVHWQYMEDIGKITVHEGKELKLTKSIYLKKHTKEGPKLFPANGKAKVGDELVVRIELRADRDMEYLHMKDHRPSGSEPVNVLSRYKYQDGLGYYEATKDTATHFYIDYLPKGTYVFEYSLRIQHRGQYQTGMTNIQCMYAPEFNSHSQSFALKVE